MSVTFTWFVYAYIGAEWVDISGDVLISGKAIKSRWGINGNKPLDRMADTGTLEFELNNATGKYSPALPGALAGWKKGLLIIFDFYYGGVASRRIRGAVDELRIDAGTTGNRRVWVTVTDWLDYAAEFPLENPAIETSKRADEAIASILTAMPIQPLTTDMGTGCNTFPVIFDTVTGKTRAYSELNKIVLSEMGYVYLTKQTANGERLVFEPEDHRSGLHPLTPIATAAGTVTALLDNAQTGMDVSYGDNLINSFKVTAYPKDVDAAATTVLFTLSKPIMLASGETQIFSANYKDQTGGGRQVNGTSMVTPVATTDYLFNTLENGTGSNITADLGITAVYGASGVKYTLVNNNAAIGYVTFLQARGKGIYSYNPISYTAENAASYNEYGYRTEQLNQLYQVTLARGCQHADQILMQEKQPRTVLESISFVPNVSDHLMNAFLQIDVGDLVAIKEDQTGVDGYYWVQGIEFSIIDGKVINCKWVVKRHYAEGKGLTLMACEFSASGTVDALQYGIIPQADNLTQRTLSAWVYAHTSGTVGSVSKHIFGAWSGNVYGYDIGLSGGTCVHYQYSDGAAPGRWESPVNSMPLNTWTHVAVTRDTSTAGTVAPLIYIGGTAQAVTEAVAPAAGTVDETGFKYLLGNLFTADYEYNRPFDGLVKDARVYNRVLSAAEVQSLAAAGTVTSGLLFQAPAVYDADVADFTDKTLAETDKVIESVVYRVGTPHGTPVTRVIT